MTNKKEVKMKLSIIIPCYNEEYGIVNLYKLLKPVLKDLKKQYDVETIFIDDGSKDNTYELLKKKFGEVKGSKIVKHEHNRNLGGSLKTGLKVAQGDFIVTMDSDCTYSPNEIPHLLALLDKKTEIVTASPYHPGGSVKNVPGYRLILSKGISFLYSLLLQSTVHTYTALFRVYKKKVIEHIRPKSNGFLGVTEMLIFPILKGYMVKEYPITLNVREFGASKLDLKGLIRLIMSHFKFLFKIFMYRVLRVNALW